MVYRWIKTLASSSLLAARRRSHAVYISQPRACFSHWASSDRTWL